MSTQITRACEKNGVYYSVGDVVEEHGEAEALVRLGFASTDDADVQAAVDASMWIDPTPDPAQTEPPARAAAKSKDK